MPNYYLKKELSNLEHVSLDDVEKVYIIKNKHLEDILFNRNLVGLDFTRACEASTCNFLMHFFEEISSLSNNVAELMILTKGMYYWLYNSFKKVFNQNLEINFVYTNRVNVDIDSAVVKVRAANFDVPAENLIICDTIASGSTIISSLKEYISYNKLRKVIIYSIAEVKLVDKQYLNIVSQMELN